MSLGIFAGSSQFISIVIPQLRNAPTVCRGIGVGMLLTIGVGLAVFFPVRSWCSLKQN